MRECHQCSTMANINHGLRADVCEVARSISTGRALSSIPGSLSLDSSCPTRSDGATAETFVPLPSPAKVRVSIIMLRSRGLNSPPQMVRFEPLEPDRTAVTPCECSHGRRKSQCMGAFPALCCAVQQFGEDCYSAIDIWMTRFVRRHRCLPVACQLITPQAALEDGQLDG